MRVRILPNHACAAASMHQEYQVLQAGEDALRSGTVLLVGKTISRNSRPAQTARVLLCEIKQMKEWYSMKHSKVKINASGWQFRPLRKHD